MTQLDAIVAGAGPAGSIAAIVLARAGARVLLLDRARFPRDKLCGDTLNPGALGVLRRLRLLGAAERGLPIDGMIVTGEAGVSVEALYGSGLTGRALRRRELDDALMGAAVESGVRVEQEALVLGPVVDTSERPRVTGVRLQSRASSAVVVNASIVIAADGRYSRVARPLGLSRAATRPRRWAVGAHFEGVTGLSARGEMHVRSGRYIGVAPLPGHLANACVVTPERTALRDPALLLMRSIADEPLLAGRFASARMVAPAVTIGPLAVECPVPGMRGLLLAGDAAGFIDPMTGDGLRFALRGGELAAEHALRALDGDGDAAHLRLGEARRREFASKWRFNLALRALAGSPAGVRFAGYGASLAPAVLRQVIRFAGDVGSAAA